MSIRYKEEASNLIPIIMRITVNHKNLLSTGVSNLPGGLAVEMAMEMMTKEATRHVARRRAFSRVEERQMSDAGWRSHAAARGASRRETSEMIPTMGRQEAVDADGDDANEEEASGGEGERNDKRIIQQRQEAVEANKDYSDYEAAGDGERDDGRIIVSTPAPEGSWDRWRRCQRGGSRRRRRA
jgi:hypothetical protein